MSRVLISLLKGGLLPDGQSGRYRHQQRGASPRLGTGDRQRRRRARSIAIAGDLVSPPFVDPHFHMDATLSYGHAPDQRLRHVARGHRRSGGNSGSSSTHRSEMVARALTYCDWAVSQGLSRHPLPCRYHAGAPVAAWTALARSPRSGDRHYLDLQLVAFPQDGLYRAEGARDNTDPRARSSASTLSAASRISNARWKMVAPR
jgi:cytosine deaminase